jgi:ribosomal protein L13E
VNQKRALRNGILVQRHDKKRRARGFSREELGKLGISIHQALKLKLPIDLRRRTIHEENLELLKQQVKFTQVKHGKSRSKKDQT